MNVLILLSSLASLLLTVSPLALAGRLETDMLKITLFWMTALLPQNIIEGMQWQENQHNFICHALTGIVYYFFLFHLLQEINVL